MKFKNTNGKEYTLTLDKYRKGRDGASKLHKEARDLLGTLYPCDPILEEVPIKIDRLTLYLDFFLPTKKMAIEVNGKQHSEFNSFHYSTKFDFITAKKRDRQKQNWCDINNVELVVLEYDRRDEWEQLILQR